MQMRGARTSDADGEYSARTRGPPTLTVVQRVEREEDSARGMLLADDAIHSATRFDRISVSQGLGHLKFSTQRLR